MAVQFRSYGSKGNFRGNLKVSDRAAAKRDRDKEFIQELKDQNVALEDRDKTLIAALNKKYDTERSARKIVEETRRQGVEAERKQRVANAKLAADFAEQEAGVHSSNVQALTELLPQVAESINEIHEKRKAYDADQAFQALEKAGLTPDQKKEFRLSRLTAEEFATGTQAWLVALREDGGITWHQYNAMMQRTGGYGLGFERWDVRQLANSLPAFIIANGNIKNADGVSFNDALTSTNLPNNSSRQGIIEEFITKFKRDSGLNNYSLAFREETLKGTLETQLNALRTKANTAMHQQSLNAGKEKDILATASELQAGTLFEKLTNLPADTPDAARTKNIFIRNQVDNAAEAIKMGAVTPEEARRLLDIEVTGPNNTKGTYGEIYPGAVNKLDDAEHERRQADLRKKNYQIQAFNQKSSIRILKAKESILALPPSDQGAAVRAIMDDPNTPIDVKVALNSWDSTAENIANEKGLAVLEETIELGLPVTREMIDRMNLSGSAKRSAEAMLSAQENEGFTELRTAARSSIRTWIRTATGRESDEATAHDQARQVEELMLEDWFMRYNSLKGKHGPKEASRLAQAALYESFQEGVDEENPKGPYKTIRGKNLEDGLEMRFEAVPTGSHSSDYNNLKISEIYDKHGNRASQQPNILGASDEQYRTWTDPSKVPRSIISNARKLASITSDKDTYITILRDQVLLSNEPVPQWLDKIAAAHEQLAELGVSRSTLELAGLEGADRQVLRMQALGEIEANAPGVNTDITVTSAYDESGEPGSDFVISNGQRGAKFYFPYSSKVVAVERNSNWETNLETNPNGPRGYGNYVDLRVQLPNGRVADVRIAHLDSVANIRNGQVLTQGAFIGTQGRTGSTTNAHMSLDWYQPGTSTPDRGAAEWFLNNYLQGGQQQQQLPPIKHAESLIKDELDGANMELVPVNQVSSGEEVTMQDILGWAAAAKTDKERDYWLNVASDLAESRRNT